VRAGGKVDNRAPQGHGGGSPDGRGRAVGTPGGATRGGRAPDGSDNLDRR
jgi:hypothetical protein